MNRMAAFVFGFAGFLVFAALSLVAVNHFRGRGTDYEDGLAAKRAEWKQAADQKAKEATQTAWKDKNAGLATVAPSAYLPVAATKLTAPENKPRPMQGDSFVVPGTKTFEEMAARKAAQTPAPAPAPAPAPKN